MGLDIVELVIGVEKAFGIEIPDQKASELTTTRKLIDYIDARLASGDSKPCLTQRSFCRLRKAAREVLGVGAAGLSPATPLAILMPVANRQKEWRAFEQAVSLPLPGLRRPASTLFGAAIVASVAAAATATVSSAWIGLAAFGLSISGILVATRGHRVHFGVSTVGELASTLALRYAQELVASDERWSRSQIEEVVIGLVREVTTDQEIDLDAHFVHDLHLD